MAQRIYVHGKACVLVITVLANFRRKIELLQPLSKLSQTQDCEMRTILKI